MKKIYYITTFMIVLIVSYLGITYSYQYDVSETVSSFNLIGPDPLYVNVNDKYIEYGVSVIYKGKDISDKVIIDSSNVNINRLGTYKVKYEVNIDNTVEYVYRSIIVIDASKPEIKLKGDSSVNVLYNGSYSEEGYIASDNYDGDITDKVEVTGDINFKKEGRYILTYTVSDSSGNESSVTREVIVKKSEVSVASLVGNERLISTYNVKKYSNTITSNSFNANGIYYEGYVNEDSQFYKIKMKDTKSELEYLFNMTRSKSNYYHGNIDLTMVENGTYQLYIIGNKEERLLNKLNGLTRILRAKVGNKLITLEYDNDYVNIIVSDFKYEYDIVIDPGHGGSDTGAGNGITAEKNINLTQSLYEKCRYEQMGYKVFLTRSDDSSGILLGDSSLLELQRRALTIGYYGAVARVVYSNHHNAVKNKSVHGFEIIVSNKLSSNDLIIEKSLYDKYKSYYNISGNRLYSRNYDTGQAYSKVNGKVYDVTDYYAVIRIPSELFNVKNVIYEPIYMSNDNDFNWYWVKKGWIEVTEIKIKEYVNYLGGDYIEDNSKCL